MIVVHHFLLNFHLQDFSTKISVFSLPEIFINPKKYNGSARGFKRSRQSMTAKKYLQRGRRRGESQLEMK